MINYPAVQKENTEQKEIGDIVFINDLKMGNSLLISFVRSYRSARLWTPAKDTNRDISTIRKVMKFNIEKDKLMNIQNSDFLIQESTV